MLKTRTMICTPAYRGEVVMQYAHCLVRDIFLSIAMGHYCEAPYFINDTYIHAARNSALKEFLKTSADYLMFIDADMSWPAGTLGRILDMPADMDIVGGVYRKKEDPAIFPFNAKPGIPLAFPVCELEGVATGFMRITRAAVERMMKAFAGRPFWHAMIDDVEYGEDLLFCRRACLIGLKVYGVFDIDFGHHGPKEWSGRACDYIEEGFTLGGEPLTQPKIAMP